MNTSKILINLNNENIVKDYLYKIIHSDCLLIFMEYCNSGNLEDYLYIKKQKNILLEEEEIKLIFLDILKGLHYFLFVFQNKFIHGDLKLNNIFLHQTKNGKLIAKVGNFFRTKFFEMYKIRNLNCSISTFYSHHQSPEILSGTEISNNTDIWSLGIILYFLCFLKYPWQVKTDLHIFSHQKNLFKGKNLEFDDKIRTVSPKMKHLMRKMLRFEENERRSFEELFEHDFFREDLEKNLQKIKNMQHEIPIKRPFECDSLTYEKMIYYSDFYDHLNFMDKQHNPNNASKDSISLELKKF